MTDRVSVIILAAGRGTRMRSPLPKVLHSIGGLSMIGHVLRTARSLRPANIVVVLAPEMEDVAIEVRRLVPEAIIALQREQHGTGDAVRSAVEALPAEGAWLVLYGDTPLMTNATATAMITSIERGAAVAAFGMTPPESRGYGRLQLRGDQLAAIVEERHADEELRRNGLCNAGAMAFDGTRASTLLDAMEWRADKGEFYLTDCVHLADQRGWSCEAIEASWVDGVGVNSQAQRAEAEQLFQERRRTEFMDAGVTLTAPSTLFVSADTSIAAGARIEPYVVMRGNVAVGANVHILGFSHIEDATIAADAVIGPFARLRPGANIGERAHVGNFVEVKNSTLETGAKANHLSYLGDADIGAGANIGAGTITCNYDGVAKHRTTIGAGSFVGSNSSLVAPVRVGEGAIVAAGSVITADVPDEALALARSRQTVLAERAPVLRQTFKDRAAVKKAR
ncbi:bifunctional UDP-N-acetylglucosamine pyrophosphorylase / Glucosamine-1-phosphate N-acetyltransferase [Arboricoccus pini]|uniref:Bifunctional protein GlmU n=1 Tax=Arboricoccus pini TaxID=1963835 RepID=A0A212R2S3_9PROT|nr:bifunctional UDP-N-acetylglucosamine diphosphorylase/glucosamine-1-phosphate N-acetyltransferase GlmU [Arboricoccus pini]SNB66302.1 bifunctional UDP-N-acetylglucosamine pyrophosphorylase / Glucosamine-1-phosphate N-acetyltransferase [Arboricoccus pini]